MKRPLFELAAMTAFAGVLGWLWRVAYARESSRYDRIEEARDSLERALRDQILPAMQAATAAQRDSFEVVTALYRQQASGATHVDQ